ncbi:MAG: TnsD family Tn7-like transposition protein, partial [Geobacteraceae bacterium]|nr:TnsD family Tn7-like transposition protein [Geobacteraceae bacterium]
MVRQMAYFPTPYPDELLYSVFARYHTRSCNISISQTLQDLFGAPNVTLDDLPSRLTDLVDRLPSESALTPASFVQEHTMLPYHKPFIAPEWLDTANLDAYDEEMKARVMSIAYNIRKRKDLHQTLHFCPKCYESDELTYGEPYWHRSHQVLGILRCHRHETWLINSKIAIKSIGPHHPLIPLGSKSLSDTSSTQSEFASDAKFHDWLAKEVNWLINGNYSGGIPCHPTILQYRYHHHLEKMGLICSNTGLLKKSELQRRFENLFREKFPIEIFDVYDGNFTSDWLARFFLAGFREHRPIIHLLMMRFFEIDSKEILWDKFEAVKPFGKGPWPCLNKVADHYLQPVVNNCSISKLKTSTNMVTGTFKCECEFQYERFGPDLSERNRTRFNKIVATGDLWDQKLMNLFRNDDTDMASTLGVTQSFIMQRLPLLLEKETDKLSIGDFVKTRKRHRNKWQEICEKLLR